MTATTKAPTFHKLGTAEYINLPDGNTAWIYATPTPGGYAVRVRRPNGSWTGPATQFDTKREAKAEAGALATLTR